MLCLVFALVLLWLPSLFAGDFVGLSKGLFKAHLSFFRKANLRFGWLRTGFVSLFICLSGWLFS